MSVITEDLKKQIIERVEKRIPENWSVSFLTKNNIFFMVVEKAPLRLSDFVNHNKEDQYVIVVGMHNAKKIEDGVKIENIFKAAESLQTHASMKKNLVPDYMICMSFGLPEKPFVSMLN